MQHTKQHEQYGQYNVTPASEMMMLSVGQPSPDILKDASKFISSDITDIQVLQYGMKQGFESYRHLVKKLLCDLTDIDKTNIDKINIDKTNIEKINTSIIDEKNIYMTNGISQAIFMLGSLFRSKYDTVFVEELTYFIMINVFKDLNYNIKTFSIDNINKLSEDLKEYPDGALIYLIPYCNNPTGKSIYINDILHLSQILPKKCICLSDETYQFLHFNNRLNRCLALYSDNIISLGTFSKILAPGIRLGWLYTKLQYENKNLCTYLDDTGFMDSGGSVNPVMANIITNNIMNNYKSYLNFIDSIKLELESKQKIIMECLTFYSGYFEFIKPDGGYFIFVKSLKINSSRLLELAKQCGFSFHIGNKFAPNKNYDDWFRLSVSYYSLEDFEKYFAHRISNLIKLIDLETQNKIDVSIFGSGRLGKLIYSKLNNNSDNLNYNILTRNFKNETIGDIIIDITTPQGTINLINFLIENKLHRKLIIGTTGHTEEEIELIKKYSHHNAVILCPNFSNGIQNLVKMIRSLDKYFHTAFIQDIHHIHKIDAPSGTALLLKRELDKLNIDTKIESIRKGEIIGTHIITLRSNNEELVLTHIADNRDIFASGCINLIEKIKQKDKGLYDFI
jgi:dihydrodipicolinate reductase/aspartate/methionine/tyrosine aminotransferase